MSTGSSQNIWLNDLVSGETLSTLLVSNYFDLVARSIEVRAGAELISQIAK